MVSLKKGRPSAPYFVDANQTKTMNLFVRPLAPEITAEELTRLFSEFGKVHSAKVIQDPETGKSKGYGFVIMKDRFEAFDAIDNLDMTYFAGSIITVKESRPRTQGSASPSRNRKQ